MYLGKLNALTGMRFIAASMIVAEHARYLGMPVPNYALDHGVSFFFVLSGFILAYVYPKLDGLADVLGFVVARIARIWPVHLATLLLAMAILQQPLDRTFAANALLLQAWIPSWPYYFSYNSPSWSVSTELFFYLLFPALIMAWSKSWHWKWIASATVIAFLIWLAGATHLTAVSQKDQFTVHGLLYINPLARLFEFVTGMVAYSAFRWLQNIAQRIPSVAFSALELIVVIAAGYSIVSWTSMLMLEPHLPEQGVQWASHSSDVIIFPIVIIVFAFERGWPSSLIGSPPLVILGELSFSIYLLHDLVFLGYRRYWQTDLIGPDYFGLTICLAVTLALAFTSWVVIEKPCRAAAKHWIKMIKKKSEAASLPLIEHTAGEEGAVH